MHLPKHLQKENPSAPIHDDVKKRTEELLSRVPPNSAWGFAAADFLQHIEQKSETDYQELLRELREDLHDGPGTMRTVLGRSFHTLRKILQQRSTQSALPAAQYPVAVHGSGTGK